MKSTGYPTANVGQVPCAPANFRRQDHRDPALPRLTHLEVKKVVVDLNSLECDNCPAKPWKDRQLCKITKWESIRKRIADSLPTINLYLLGESIPYNRFVYDEDSDYSANGLRYYLRAELIGSHSDDKLYEYLKQRGILLVDCALCPLHKLKSNKKKRRDAATLCLKRNTLPYLEINISAPVITIFPSGCGFACGSMPQVERRIAARFQFTRLAGLKNTIERLLTAM